MTDVHSVDRWQSLGAHVALARRLPGDTAADVDVLERWLGRQCERVEDRAFARLFTEHVDLPGVVEDDYLHRIVEVDGLRLLGGIRFHGQDVSRPFVEIVAWTRLDGGDSDEVSVSQAWHPTVIERLRRVVAHEWRAFSPGQLRLHRPEDVPNAARPLPTPGATWTVDVSVHVADVRAMDGDVGELTLEPPGDLESVVELVSRRYDAIGRHDPALARNVMPADADELAECRSAGSLFSMRVGPATVGAIATLAGTIDWIEGDVIVEEVVSLEHAGQGYAALAQRALAARYARDARPRRLIGTIDEANVASRRSAERAGRPAASRYLFVPLPSLDP